jgi:hypothetical protein
LRTPISQAAYLCHKVHSHEQKNRVDQERNPTEHWGRSWQTKQNGGARCIIDIPLFESG